MKWLWDNEKIFKDESDVYNGWTGCVFIGFHASPCISHSFLFVYFYVYILEKDAFTRCL